MGNILNPGGDNSFTTLVHRKDSEIFVDKTAFIDKISSKINADKRFFAVTRPRRFGKTVTADMLLSYYSKAYAGQNVFDNLKISDEKYIASYEKHLNKYDVIYIDMNTISDRYEAYKEDDELHVNGINTFVDFLQYSVIEELKENSIYENLIKNSSKVGKKSLSAALDVICTHTKEKFIFIMDEWDLIYRDYREDIELQKKFIDFLKGLFKSKDGRNALL